MNTGGGPDPSDRRLSNPDSDSLGFEENRNYVGSALGALVPQALANRMVTVSVETDRKTFAVGEPVSFTVTIRNRLPVPVAAETTQNRLWGWTIDGELEASDEPRLRNENANAISLRASERKRITREWNRRFRRTREGRTRWEPASPGTHELGVFLTTRGRPTDSVTIEIQR